MIRHLVNSPHVDMSLYSDTSPRLEPNQSLFLLINDVCLAQRNDRFYFIVFDLIQPWMDPTIFRGLEVSALAITLPRRSHELRIRF